MELRHLRYFVAGVDIPGVEIVKLDVTDPAYCRMQPGCRAQCSRPTRQQSPLHGASLTPYARKGRRCGAARRIHGHGHDQGL
jgi:hypothetical protein